eukprot:TRINITY_DN25560_c0_g1_i1.p1 TRINITY_DN25560_c0_g1~~TRINITY_DN25560_c0_g1_i1.p1  ORF type:complete len:228 (-),score=43.05 TRINITY_DN25560_c0_g1_i1:103-786(-)
MMNGDDVVPSFGGEDPAIAALPAPPVLPPPAIDEVVADGPSPSFGGVAVDLTSIPRVRPPAIGQGALAAVAAEFHAANGLTAPPQGAEDDELTFCASVDKVQEMTEQIAEFLIKFNPEEQKHILAPFLRHYQAVPALDSERVEPHIDEARRFVHHYLEIYNECERDLILEKWRPAFDTASLSTATESLTPSVTPPGSVTPTAVTPREFLSARRDANDTYHSGSPMSA